MTDDQSIVTARIDRHLKAAFEAICKAEDITTSQMLRGFIRQTVSEYNAKHAQATLPTIKPAPAKGKRK